MAFFIVRHQHEANCCPADPYMGAMLLITFDYSLLRSNEFATVKKICFDPGLASGATGDGQRCFDSSILGANRVGNFILSDPEKSSALVASRMKVKTTPSAMDPVPCRYCVGGQNFLRMLAHQDGRFICGRCGHVEIPNVGYGCNCGNCAELAKYDPEAPVKGEIIEAAGLRARNAVPKQRLASVPERPRRKSA